MSAGGPKHFHLPDRPDLSHTTIATCGWLDPAGSDPLITLNPRRFS